MRGCGDWSQPVTAGDLRYRSPQMDEFGARILNRAADGSADLELGAQKFPAEAPAKSRLEFVDQRRRRLTDQIPRTQVDEQVLLFNANRETRFVDRHQSVPRSSATVPKTDSNASPRTVE